MILKIALLATFGSVGFGTYFGLTLVFLRSKPTIEVPLGTTTPPFTLLNLYKILSSFVKSKLESNVNDKVLDAPDGSPAGLTAFATPESFLIAKPGLLSTMCSPGKSNIVVLSTKSLSSPRKYENLAASIKALCIVLKGLVNELP